MLSILSGICTIIAWIFTFLTIIGVFGEKDSNEMASKSLPLALFFWWLAFLFIPN